MKYNTQGETLSLGAFSLESSSKLDALMTMGSQTSARQMNKAIVELTSKIVVGGEQGTLLRKMEIDDNY